jgi:hypothetical protein
VTQSTSESFINTNRLEDEIARLRLIVGSLRTELWDNLWAGLAMDQRKYDDETDKLIYGDRNEQ